MSRECKHEEKLSKNQGKIAKDRRPVHIRLRKKIHVTIHEIPFKERYTKKIRLLKRKSTHITIITPAINSSIENSGLRQLLTVLMPFVLTPKPRITHMRPAADVKMLFPPPEK